MERKYTERWVKLQDGRKAKILIPGLDACLVLTEDNQKFWAITPWDYQRRLNNIKNAIDETDLESELLLTPPESSKKRGHSPKKLKGLYDYWFPNSIHKTAIAAYL